MYNIKTTEAFNQLCPTFRGVMIKAKIKNTTSSEALWQEIKQEGEKLMAKYTTESIKQRSGIAATRQAYKALGKDPSRYRPACEQLARRVLQGKGLYHVNTVVDVLNLVSLASGYSTAALDAERIVGNDITLGIGRANEPYEGIGRGMLNIEQLPTYRDETGAFATPTSDSTRTMLTLDSTLLLVIINGYDGNEEAIKQAADYTLRLLKDYAQGSDFEVAFYCTLV